MLQASLDSRIWLAIHSLVCIGASAGLAITRIHLLVANWGVDPVFLLTMVVLILLNFALVK